MTYKDWQDSYDNYQGIVELMSLPNLDRDDAAQSIVEIFRSKLNRITDSLSEEDKTLAALYVLSKVQ